MSEPQGELSVYVVGTPYADDEIQGVAFTREAADAIANKARGQANGLEVLEYPPHGELDALLPEVLAAMFPPEELELIGRYLEKRAIEASATSRADALRALLRLGAAVTEAREQQ
ncbi:hypothetical protein JNW90_10675 [Micromonospora sp. STR1s_5]|nr:hypothetical protein [Micromonospora sp. STR1s_5]